MAGSSGESELHVGVDSAEQAAAVEERDESAGTWTPDKGLPADLTDRQLFSVLLHLIHPGTLASSRAAAMLALFAYLSRNAELAPRAERWLGSSGMLGKWSGWNDWDTYPEIFSVQFMLMMR